MMLAVRAASNDLDREQSHAFAGLLFARVLAHRQDKYACRNTGVGPAGAS